MNQRGAENYCKARGAILLSVKDGRDQDFVNLLLRDLHDQNFNFLWLGLSIAPGAGQMWMWADNINLGSTGYNNWGEGEPQRFMGMQRRNCGIIYTGSKAGLWASTHKCGQSQAFICQIQEGVVPVEPTTTPVPYYCDDGWDRMGDRCIQMNRTESTWPVARQNCQNMGAELVKIRNADDNQFITDKLDRQYWIGLHKRNAMNNFTWNDETTYPEYTNWGPGEPNDVEDNEACVEIMSIRDNRLGMWNDISCSRPFGYICDKGAYLGVITPPATQPMSPDWTDKCGVGWEDHLGTDWCYMYMPEFVTWGQARDTCWDFGGALASIMSPEEQTYIAGRVRDKQTLVYWTGFNDLDTDRAWTWIDGSAQPFFSWGEGWPKEGQNQHCGVFMARTLTWEARECNGRYGYICKKRGDVPDARTTPQPTSGPGQEMRCNNGEWEEYGDYCYRFIKRAKKDWNFARFNCLQQNSDLVSIHDNQELDFIMSNVREKIGPENPFHADGVWIGMQDFRGRHYYQWSDHSEVVYTNWEPGEPNNWNGNYEECTKLRIDSGKWNDEDCTNNDDFKLGWVCKHRKRSRPTIGTTTPNTIRFCPEGSTHRYRERCLHINTTLVTFDEARDFCANWSQPQDSRLVNVHERFTNSYIGSHIDDNTGPYWMGYSNRGNDDGTWFWTDGKQTPGDYTNWDGQFTGNERESCGSIRSAKGQQHGMWRVMGCNQKGRFVCQAIRADRTPPTPASTPTQNCESGWKAYGDDCLKEGYPSWGNDLMKHTWSEASFNCRLMGAELASIHSSATNDFIKDNLERDVNKDPRWWIGLHNNTRSGQQEWADGSGVSYTNWKDGQPESHNGQERCVKFDFSDGGRWGYENCDVVANWVCMKKKWDPPSPSVTPPLPSEAPCSPDMLVKKHDASEGLHANCQHAGGGQGRTLEDCKRETCQLGGNTAAYAADQDGRCSVKRCFGGDLELDRDHGNYDIYTIDGPSCDDDGWKFYNDQCWYISKDVNGQNDISFFEATNWCNDNGGHLASLHSSQQNAVISRLTSLGNIRLLWLGMNRLDLGPWQWTDGTPVDYINWARGEPNDHHFVQLCVNFYGSNGFWNDDNCGDKNGFVCVKPKGDVSPVRPTPTFPVDGFCPEGFRGIGNKCLRLMGKTEEDGWKTWQEAVTECRSMGDGYDLASINNHLEQALMNVVLGDIEQSTWIGMSTRVGKQKQWVDNSPITWENWANGEPNSQDEDCVEVYWRGSTLGRWNDVNCDQRRAYMCQYRKWMASPIPTTVEPFPKPCSRDGYVDYQGECYKLMASGGNWQSSRDSCRQDEGGDLVSVHNKPENSFLKLFFRDTRGPLWTGLNDLDKRGTFHWSNGWVMDMTMWGRGQPVNDENLRCGIMLDSGNWNLTRCDNRYPAICKIPSTQAPQPPPDLPGKCPDGENWVDFHRNCYHIEDGDTMNFANAELECGHKAANLVSIHDMYQNYFVLQRIKALNIRRRVWLGLTRPYGNAGAWRWTDGSPLQYENWAPGEPSDADGTTENCVEMYQGNGLWNDIDCDTLNKIACRNDKEIYTPAPTTPPPTMSQFITSRRTRPSPPMSTPGSAPPSTSFPPLSGIANRPTLRAPLDPGMSEDAKIGIGFGVLIGVMAVVVIAMFLNRRRDQIPKPIG